MVKTSRKNISEQTPAAEENENQQKPTESIDGIQNTAKSLLHCWEECGQRQIQVQVQDTSSTEPAVSFLGPRSRGSERFKCNLANLLSSRSAKAK